MNTTPSAQLAPPQAPAERPPLRILLTILHLAAYGTIGWAIISGMGALIGSAFGSIFALGLGVVLLVVALYALFGIAWFEVLRVSGLYRLEGIPPLRWQPRDRPGFVGWLVTVGRQAIDGRMWVVLANFVISAVLGALVIALSGTFVWSIAMVTNPDDFWWGFAGLLLCPFGILGLALLHRTISVPMISFGVQEASLRAALSEKTQQREGAVRAADVERTRIERDLHDGVQPRLVSVGMTLGLAQQQIDENPERAKELVAEAHTSTKAAITELRQLARGIYASVLDDRGLDAALSALAARSHIPVHLDVRLDGRPPRDAEAAVYFAIAESLTNAAKHSRASECRVTVRQRATQQGETLWARIEDNGAGGATVVPGGGLDGIINRVTAAGGTTTLDSPQGGPTALEVSVPCVF